MDCAEAEEYIAAGYGDDLAIGEECGQLVERDTIVWVVECRNKNDSVCDVEIRVACGQSLPVEINRPRHRERLKIERPASLIFHFLEARDILLQRLVIQICRIIFNDGDHRSRIHESREIIYVAMRIIAGDSAIDPEHVCNPKVIAKEFP